MIKSKIDKLLMSINKNSILLNNGEKEAIKIIESAKNLLDYLDEQPELEYMGNGFYRETNKNKMENNYKEKLLEVVDYFENIADQSGLLEDMEHLPKAEALREFINNNL